MDRVRNSKFIIMLLEHLHQFTLHLQTDQSQMLLNNSERFGLLLAENVELGSSKTVESENIGKHPS